MIRLLLRPLGFVAPAFALSIVLAGTATAQDIEGARDFGDLPRVAAATIRAYKIETREPVVLPLGRFSASDDQLPNTITLEGHVTHTDYVVRPRQTADAMARYYDDRLRDADYRIILSCAGISGCGPSMGSFILNDGVVAPVGFADGLFHDHLQVRVARKDDTWILLHMIQGPDRALVYQVVIEGARELK